MQEPTDIDWPHVYSALTDGQRREVIQYLLTADGPATVPAIAAALAGADSDNRTPSAVTARLYHVTLPTLVAAELVEWDREVDAVTLTPVIFVPVGVLNPPGVAPLSPVDTVSGRRPAHD